MLVVGVNALSALITDRGENKACNKKGRPLGALGQSTWGLLISDSDRSGFHIAA